MYFTKKIEWLGYKCTQTGISSFENKTSVILAKTPQWSLRRLRSFLLSSHYISKVIPNLAQLCHFPRPLLNKSDKFFWTEEQIKHFNTIKDKIAASTENSRYIPKLDVRAKCDVSRCGLGAALEPNTSDR